MRALWLQDGGVRYTTEAPSPEAAPGEALLRVRLGGICATDLALVAGYAGFTGIPGHEFVADVVEAPGAEGWVGRRVVAEINVACGRCAECAAGRRPHCAERAVLGIRGRPGAFGEKVCAPVVNLHAVPADLPDEVAVFAEPVAAALEVQEQVHVGAGERVVVVGDGKLGQLLARTLARTGCALTVVGRHRDKLDRLARRGIAVCAAGELPARAADVVVECTGNPEGLERARRAVRPGGTIVLKSTYPGAATLDLSSIVVDEVTLVGSRCGPFGKALALLADGLDVSDLVSAVYPLPEGEAAFAAAGRPGMLKVLLTIPPEGGPA
ncbi:MAG TPA: alcohol dehydrogenase catalytic domain-containing protein [Vicinamibacteria bacterium]|jgi:threonine dehydrogenase-like Zn-dependent dehydrogenase